MRERVETVYHPASTCRMAPREEGGVVGSDLRVYGVQGLRVCDASVFPWIVSGHTVRCFLSFFLLFLFGGVLMAVLTIGGRVLCDWGEVGG